MSTAFAEGIPKIEGRVGVLRVEPVWEQEELPIILIDFDGERKEVRTQSPRDYEHTLTVNVIVYVAGETDKTRIELLDIMASVEAVMNEWQFIRASDVDPALAEDGDYYLIDHVKAGDSVNYFVSPDGDRDHLAVRLSFEATFFTDGNSTGEAMKGAPKRNRLADFLKMLVNWIPRRSPGANAADEYGREADGENNEP